MKAYTMTKEQYQQILDASKPTPVMFLTGGQPMFDTPYENAMRAWRNLGKELGFDYESVQSTSNKYKFIAEEA